MRFEISRKALKNESSLFKLIYWLALSAILILMLGPSFLNSYGLEFTDESFKLNLIKARFFIVPICIFLALFGKINVDDSGREIKRNIVYSIGAAIFSYFFLAIMMFASMCSWTNRDTLYINKENKNIKIIERSLGCGAFDSDFPTIKTFRVKEISKYLIYTKEIDIEKIDKEEWVRN